MRTVSEIWDNTERTNIRIIGVPEKEETKKGSEKIFEEIIVENSLNFFLLWGVFFCKIKVDIISGFHISGP